MRYVVKLTDEAIMEAEDAAEWYETQRYGLGVRFIRLLKLELDTIAETPLAFPKVRRNIRGRTMGGFPYSIYYAMSDTQVNVIAVFHHSRNPDIWRKRIK